MEDTGVRERHEVAKFALSAGIFLSPYFLFFAVTIGLFFASGEIASVSRVIDRQAAGARAILLGMAYSNPAVYYKMESAIRRKPRVLALGTSRIMQVRKEFFADPDAFWNAGGAVDRMKHLRIFLDRVPVGGEPSLILLSIDQNFLNGGWDASNPDHDFLERLRAPESRSHIIATRWTTIYRDLFSGKFSLKDLAASPGSDAPVGLSAHVHGDGFRNDGSRREGSLMKEDSETHVLDMREAKTAFSPGPIDPQLLAELDAFLQEADRRGIRVIGLLPPYAPNLYAAIVSAPAEDRQRISYVFDSVRALEPIFRSHGFSVYDGADARAYGSSDEEMLDNQHGSEKTYLRLLLSIAERDEALRSFMAPLDKLRESMYTRESSYQVFD